MCSIRVVKGVYVKSIPGNFASHILLFDDVFPEFARAIRPSYATRIADDRGEIGSIQ